MVRSRAAHSPATDTGHARDYVAIALAYAKRAAADKRQTEHCRWVRLAAQRHLDDLKRQNEKDWPYRFDPWHGNDVCDFAEKMPHVEGNWCKCPGARRGEHLERCGLIDLEPFQIFILVCVFGWRDKETGFRRFTLVYEELARKNAKSTLTAIVSLYCLACEDEPGPQVLTAATTFDQAKKVFHPAKRMVEKLPALQEAFALIPWAKSITCGDNGGYMQPIHSKSKSQDGHNPHLVTMDELHAHSDRGLYDVMVSAFGARLQPLLWIITTAGFNLLGICYEQRTFATKVLTRAIVAEHVFAIIFTLDGPKDFEPERKKGDNPYDASVWVKANPLLPAAPSLQKEIAKRAIEARASPSAEANFFTKNLNKWLGAASAWLAEADQLRIDAARADVRRRALADAKQDRALQLAQARGDGDAAIRRLQRGIDIRDRARKLQSDESLSEAEAIRKATTEWDEEAKARMVGNVRATFREGMRAALDGNIGDFVKNWWKDRVAKGMEDALNSLSDLIANLFSKAGKDDDGKGVGGFFKSIAGLLGGAKAGGSAPTTPAGGNGVPADVFKSMPRLPGFATGGSFKVGGMGGIDNNLVAFRATKGEMVDIRRPGNDNGGAGARIFDLRGAVVTEELIANMRVAASADTDVKLKGVNKREQRIARRRMA